MIDRIIRRLRKRRFFRRNWLVLPSLAVGGLVSLLIVFAGPLLVDGSAHRALNETARSFSSLGGPLWGLDLTVARASVFSLVRDLRQNLELDDHGRRVSRADINAMQFLTRGSLATVGDLVRTFGVPLTERQAGLLDLCRKLDDLKPGERLTVLADPYQYGVASWYGPGFHSRLAASGEIYNMYDMTAAHRTLPLQTLVRVVQRRTGKSVVVRINDRGPYVGGRIIDLSWRAREKLGVQGIASVYLEVLDSRPLARNCP